jgi:hypothetical protein
MWRWIGEQWEQIRGDAKWYLLTLAGGAVVGGVTATWGWILTLPGPAIFCLSLAALAFGISITNRIQEWWLRRVREQREQDQEKRPLPSSLASSLETQPSSLSLPKEIPQPVSIVEKKPQASLLSPSIPAHLTGPQATKLITNLRECSKDIQLKVCSTQEHIAFTKELVDAFRAAGYTFIIDEKRNESFFLAQSTHNKILIRYRENGPPSHSQACSNLFIKFTLVFTYKTVIATDPFPEESTTDYFQIEIGGAP